MEPVTSRLACFPYPTSTESLAVGAGFDADDRPLAHPPRLAVNATATIAAHIDATGT
jgi:hypothetical protein